MSGNLDESVVLGHFGHDHPQEVPRTEKDMHMDDKKTVRSRDDKKINSGRDKAKGHAASWLWKAHHRISVAEKDGRGLSFKTAFVMEPNKNSRTAECPQAPMTSKPALRGEPLEESPGSPNPPAPGHAPPR